MEKTYFPESTFARTFSPCFAVSSAWGFKKAQCLVLKQTHPKIRGDNTDVHMKQCRDSDANQSSMSQPIDGFLELLQLFISRQKNINCKNIVTFCMSDTSICQILSTGNISADTTDSFGLVWTYLQRENYAEEINYGLVRWLWGWKPLLHKADNLSVVPRTHSGRRKRTPKSCFLTSTGMCEHMRAHNMNTDE